MAAVLVLFTACSERIVHDLSEAEANRLLTKLHDGGIEAHKEHQPDGQWLIAVPSGDSIRAIRLLEAARLLRAFKPSGEKPSMLASREEQRLRSEHVLSSNIEATLASVDGVLEAHVHLNLPAGDPLFGQAFPGNKGSASVLIVGTERFGLSRDDVAALVAGASGIEPGTIAVIVASERQSGMPPASDTARAASWVDSTAGTPGLSIAVLQYARPLAAALTLLAFGCALFLWRTRHVRFAGRGV